MHSIFPRQWRQFVSVDGGSVDSLNSTRRRSRQLFLLAACGALLIALIIAAAAAAATNMRSRAISDAERELRNTSRVLAEQIAQSFRAVELVQASLAEKFGAQGIASAQALATSTAGPETFRMLADRISGLPQIDGIGIIDEHGQLVCWSRDQRLADINVADRGYFRDLRGDDRRESIVSEPVVSRDTGAWTVYVARRLTKPDGGFLGLVLAAIRLTYLEEHFEAVLPGRDGSIALFRQDGILLARFPHREESVGRLLPAVLSGLQSHGVIVRRVSDVDGRERLIAPRAVPGFPLLVSVTSTVAEASASVAREALLLSGVGGCLALAVGAVVFMLVRRSALEQRHIRRLLDLALNNMSQALVMFDRDARLVLWNERYLRMYKLPADKVRVGSTLREQYVARIAAGTVRPDRDPDDFCAEVAATLPLGGATGTFDTADGRTIRTVNRALDGGGWVATHEDITDRRQAERDRDRNRDFLHRVIEAIPVMIIVKDARDLSYTLINPASEKAFGRSGASVYGKTAYEVFPSEQARDLERLERGVIDSKLPRVIEENEIVLPGGAKRLHKTTLMPILSGDGEPLHLMIVAEDMSDRKSMELQLRQAVKMEAIGNLTGGIAHDFNNLLMVIIGNLDLLVDTFADNEGARELLDPVLHSALRGAELTRQLLAFSRRQPLNPKQVDLGQVATATARMLGRTLGEDIVLEMKMPDDLWPVCVDEAQFETSIVNIAVNARDAMPTGGTLTIEARNHVVGPGPSAGQDRLPPGDYVALAIGDTGTGMPPDLLARVFEPFVTTKPRGKGTGLGLSMVYGFVKQSGGDVEIASEVGRGTTLTMYLPRSQAIESPSLVPSSAPLPLGRGETVLAVDDNKHVLQTVKRQLEDLGYNVVTAGSAFSALSMLERGVTVNLLFTDVIMPGGMNGRALADEASRRWPDLGILLTSGFTDTCLPDDGPSERPYNLLAKPYRKSDLARAVRDVLDAARPVDTRGLEDAPA